MMTTHGDLPIDALERTLILEERPRALVLNVEYRLKAETEHGGELVRREAFKRRAPREQPDADGLLTIAQDGAHVRVPADRLVRTVLISGQDSVIETTVVEEWTLDGVIVKRSPWVIAWQASVVAESVVGGLG